MFTAVILGAGKSTRMKANKSKLLFNISGKPVINHIISSLKDAKSKSNLCVINNDSIGIKNIVDEEKVNHVYHTVLNGTAGAVKAALKKKAISNNKMLILCGDIPFIKSTSIKRIINKLKTYDAVVVGVRAYNTIAALAFAQKELNKYVQAGGTMVVQYNTSHRLVTKQLAPYALSLSRDRVTDEFAPVTILDPSHSVLNSPNKITQEDFKGWVQERGLYFPNKWAEEFTPILAMNDKGAPQTKGSLLVARYGKGHYVYTGLSFFRELPAGVAAAYRLFANIISLGK